MRHLILTGLKHITHWPGNTMVSYQTSTCTCSFTASLTASLFSIYCSTFYSCLFDRIDIPIISETALYPILPSKHSMSISWLIANGWMPITFISSNIPSQFISVHNIPNILSTRILGSQIFSEKVLHSTVTLRHPMSISWYPYSCNFSKIAIYFTN